MSDKTITVLTPNPKYTFEIRKVMDSDPLVVKEAWVENVYQINDGDFYDTNVFIDIGANIGAVSLQVAAFNDEREQNKQIKVIAYEPLQSNLVLLDKNVKRNSKIEDVKIIKKGVWKENGTMTITDSGGSSSIMPEKHRENAPTEEIEVITLEQVFRENGLTECDVMKIDVEGAEYQMLLAADKRTLRRIKYLTLEFDGGHEAEFGELMLHLAEHFNLHIIGRPSGGGYVYGRRY